MRPVSIETFIRVVYAEDDHPPSLATIRRRCPHIPGAFRDGRRWRIDLDTYYLTMERRLQGIPEVTPAQSRPQIIAADDDEAAFLEGLAFKLG